MAVDDGLRVALDLLGRGVLQHEIGRTCPEQRVGRRAHARRLERQEERLHHAVGQLRAPDSLGEQRGGEAGCTIGLESLAQLIGVPDVARLVHVGGLVVQQPGQRLELFLGDGVGQLEEGVDIVAGVGPELGAGEEFLRVKPVIEQEGDVAGRDE